jgi:hypothetical protein
MKDVLSCKQLVAGEPSESVGGIVSSVGRSQLAVAVNFRKQNSSPIRLVRDGC